MRIKNSAGCFSDWSTAFEVAVFVGLEDGLNFPIRLHPNPSNGWFFIVSENHLHDVRFRTVDMLGKVHFTDQISRLHVSHEVSTTGISDGIYLVHIEAGGNNYLKKLVIRK